MGGADDGTRTHDTRTTVRHTHASWLIDQGVDLERVRHRLGHGDLTTTTRYVKILDEEDSTAADVMSQLLKAAE